MTSDRPPTTNPLRAVRVGGTITDIGPDGEIAVREDPDGHI